MTKVAFYVSLRSTAYPDFVVDVPCDSKEEAEAIAHNMATTGLLVSKLPDDWDGKSAIEIDQNNAENWIAPKEFTITIKEGEDDE